MTEEKKDVFDRIMNTEFMRPWEPTYRRCKEVLLYLFFGGLTTVISIGSYSALVLSGMNALVANLISWVLAVLFAYVTNSIWVFESRPTNGRERISQMLRFYGGRVGTLVLEELILLVFIELLSLNEFGVKFAAQIGVLVGNYLISKFFVFKKKNKLDE